MSILMRTVHRVVFPDGLVQDFEAGVPAREGDLLASEALGITSEPTGKWFVERIEERQGPKGEEYPHTRLYYVRPF